MKYSQEGRDPPRAILPLTGVYSFESHSRYVDLVRPAAPLWMLWFNVARDVICRHETVRKLRLTALWWSRLVDGVERSKRQKQVS